MTLIPIPMKQIRKRRRRRRNFLLLVFFLKYVKNMRPGMRFFLAVTKKLSNTSYFNPCQTLLPQ